MLKELNADSASPAPTKAGAQKTAPKKSLKAGGQKKGALTVRDAILSAVNAAKEAIPANEIIAEAVRLSGGAVASIRTQINALTRGGDLLQQPYQGRGFKYKVGIQFAFCRGVVDELLRIWIGDDEVFNGSVTHDTTLTINNPDLFGGDDLGNGGVGGTMR